VLSAHVEVEHATELLAGGQGVGYLLKSRVTDLEEFLDALQRIARGGSVVDPALVAELVAARRQRDPPAELSEREREVLALMAEGRSNAGDRAAVVGDRGDGGEARPQHPDQAGPARDRRRPPPGAGGAQVPGGPLTVAAAVPAVVHR
jgi:hypothetical protein